MSRHLVDACASGELSAFLHQGLLIAGLHGDASAGRDPAAVDRATEGGGAREGPRALAPNAAAAAGGWLGYHRAELDPIVRAEGAAFESAQARLHIRRSLAYVVLQRRAEDTAWQA
jgi:hypothetical protein